MNEKIDYQKQQDIILESIKNYEFSINKKQLWIPFSSYLQYAVNFKYLIKNKQYIFPVGFLRYYTCTV